MDKNGKPLACQCLFSDGIEILQKHLSKTRKLLEDGDFKNEREFRALLTRLEKVAEELKRQQRAHFQFRLEYAREMVELVKTQALNVGPISANANYK